jgi:hypothetical protein
MARRLDDKTSPAGRNGVFMKIVLVGANGTIGELVQKAFAGAGHEIVKVGRPFKWIIHPNWYTTAAFRAKNNGMLGRSNGCITIDPIENN